MPREELAATRRAPLTWLVLPLLSGIVAARMLPDVPALAPTLLALLLAGGALFFVFREQWGDHQRATGFFFGAAFMLALAYSLVRLPEPPEWFPRPAREADLSLQIERVYSASDKFGRVVGIGRILEAPRHSEEAEGHLTFFSLMHRQPVEEADYYRSQVLRGRAVLEHIHAPLPDYDPEGVAGFRRYLESSDIWFTFGRGTVLEVEDEGSLLYQQFQYANLWITKTLREGRPEGVHAHLADVLPAMLLGNKALLGEEMRESFISSGTMHFFAVSGLHVGLVAGMLFLVCKLVRVPKPLAVFFGLLILLGYVQVTGAPPSAVRAWIMIAVFTISHAFVRRHSPVSALLASAAVVLVWSPAQLFQAGFQLSYVVVFGILLYGAPLADSCKERLRLDDDMPLDEIRGWRRWRAFALRWLVDLLCISWSAFLFSAPLILGYFKIFAPASVLLNVPLVGLATLAVACGFLSVGAGLVWAGFAAFINHAAWVLLWMMLGLVALFLQVPGSFMQRTYRWDGLELVVCVAMAACLFLPRDWTRMRALRFYLLPLGVLVLSLFFTVSAAS